jgi:hypothetical protein
MYKSNYENTLPKLRSGLYYPIAMPNQPFDKTQDHIQNPLKILMIIGRAWGLLPLTNLSDPKKIQFKLKSWYFFYTCLVWLLNLFMLILTLYGVIAIRFFNFTVGTTRIIFFF